MNAEVYEKFISDLQSMIQSQDNKISFLLALCCLPIGQIEFFKKIFNYVVNSYNFGFALISIQYFFWVGSIAILLYALSPRKSFNKDIPNNASQYFIFIKNDYKRVMKILVNKIFYIKLSLLFISVWSLFLIIEIFCMLQGNIHA